MLLFLATLTICIICHELSHFLAARLSGCGVEVLSIGFGRPLIKKKFGKTTYQIAPFLLGGYCKLKGELTTTGQSGDFVNLPYRKKFYIAVAGCYCNILMGAIAYWLCVPLQSYSLYYFAVLSFVLGISNLLPIPALDGGYIVYFPLFRKIYGVEKGLRVFRIVTNYSFIILMILNVLCIPFLLLQLMKGIL